MTERVHGQQRRHAGEVTMIICERSAGHGRATGGLNRDDVNVGAGDLVADEWERHTRKIAAATRARGDHIHFLLADLGKLLLGFQADDGLVQHDMVEHAAKRIARLA